MIKVYGDPDLIPVKKADKYKENGTLFNIASALFALSREIQSYPITITAAPSTTLEIILTVSGGTTLHTPIALASGKTLRKGDVFEVTHTGSLTVEGADDLSGQYIVTGAVTVVTT